MIVSDLEDDLSGARGAPEKARSRQIKIHNSQRVVLDPVSSGPISTATGHLAAAHSGRARTAGHARAHAERKLATIITTTLRDQARGFARR